jgi:hypothetical protein
LLPSLLLLLLLLLTPPTPVEDLKLAYELWPKLFDPGLFGGVTLYGSLCELKPAAAAAAFGVGLFECLVPRNDVRKGDGDLRLLQFSDAPDMLTRCPTAAAAAAAAGGGSAAAAAAAAARGDSGNGDKGADRSVSKDL